MKNKLQYSYNVCITQNVYPGVPVLERYFIHYPCCKECLIRPICLEIEDPGGDSVNVERPCLDFLKYNEKTIAEIVESI